MAVAWPGAKGDGMLGIPQTLHGAFLGPSRDLPLSFWHSCPPSRGDSLGHPQQSLASGNAHFPSEQPQGGGDLRPPMYKHHLIHADTHIVMCP